MKATKNTLVLPTQCKKCGGIYDLWHDMSGEVNEGVASEIERSLKQSLCWSCRSGMMVAVADSDDDSDFELSNTLLDED